MKHTRPPWWPEQEPWPPKRFGNRSRRSFFRRMGCLLAVFNVFIIAIALLVIEMIFRWKGFMPPTFHRDSPLPFMAGAIVLVFGLVIWVAAAMRHISMPVGDLLEASERLGEGDYSTKLQVRGPREIRTVARAFNTLTERLQANDARRRNLLADVTHELRTPLTVIQGTLEGMLDGVYPADEARLRGLLEETHVLGRRVEDLRTLALVEGGTLPLHREVTDLAELLQDVATTFYAQADAAGVTIKIAAESVLANVDPERMRQVLANLVVNALRYTPDQGTIELELKSIQGSNEAQAVIIVRDTGPGIAEEDLPFVFERFYKTSDSGGMGLGLAIARHIVQNHGGTIQAESAGGAGTQIRIVLPATPVGRVVTASQPRTELCTLPERQRWGSIVRITSRFRHSRNKTV